MKTVLHLERKFTSNTETFIVNQVNTIQNYEVIVGTIINTNLLSCNKEVVTPSGISIYSKSAWYLSKKTLQNLFNQLSNYKPSLIHVHYLVDAFFFLKFVKNFNLPKIVSCYGYDVSSFPKKYFGIGRLLLKSVFKEYDYFLAMSPDMQNDLIKLGCPPSKIIVHYYGTDTTRFFNAKRSYVTDNSKIKILTVGTLEGKKAQHLVIDALSILKQNGIDFEYHLVGDGDYCEICEKKTSEYNLNDKIFFHGYVPHYKNELVIFFNEADIFVLPSIISDDYDKEGIPGTIIEAMASGLPVITTYHAGIPFVVENFREGLLLQEKDINGLAEALKKLITNQTLRKQLGEGAQIKALNHLDLKVGTARLEKIYDEVIYKTKYRIQRSEDGRQNKNA